MLLLLAPLDCTFQKLLELAVFGERSHQLEAEPEHTLQRITYVIRADLRNAICLISSNL